MTAQPQMEQNEDKTSGTAGEDADIDWTSDIIIDRLYKKVKDRE